MRSFSNLNTSMEASGDGALNNAIEFAALLYINGKKKRSYTVIESRGQFYVECDDTSPLLSREKLHWYNGRKLT